MNVFGTAEARHFCQGFANASTFPDASLRKHCQAFPDRRSTVVHEGTPEFDELRACILRNAERSLFLSVSHYRRAFDLFTTSASSWAHVTLYYGAYFAAHGLLGLFGGWIHAPVFRIDVAQRSPGNQALQVSRGPKDWGTHRGSHERFWDYFYGGVTGLIPYVKPNEAFALQPLNSTVEWQSRTRNNINYDSWEALELAAAFKRSHRGSKSRSTLPPPMNTQLEVLETLLVLALRFRSQLNLRTDAVDRLSTAPADLRKHLRTLVYGTVPPRRDQALRKGLITP